MKFDAALLEAPDANKSVEAVLSGPMPVPEYAGAEEGDTSPCDTESEQPNSG